MLKILIQLHRRCSMYVNGRQIDFVTLVHISDVLNNSLIQNNKIWIFLVSSCMLACCMHVNVHNWLRLGIKCCPLCGLYNCDLSLPLQNALTWNRAQWLDSHLVRHGHNLTARVGEWFLDGPRKWHVRGTEPGRGTLTWWRTAESSGRPSGEAAMHRRDGGSLARCSIRRVDSSGCGTTEGVSSVPPGCRRSV